MTKKRIGLIHYTYPPVIGGVEKVIFDHAQLFSRYDYDVTVFAGEGHSTNPKVKLKIIPEFKSLRVTNPNLFEKILSETVFPDEFIRFSDKILEKIEKEFKNIDVFIIHNVLNLTLNLCLNRALAEYIKKHSNKKFIGWMHDIALSPERKKKDFTNPAISQMIYKPVENVKYVGISNFLKERLNEEFDFPTKSMTIVSNGIDLNTFLNLHPITQKIIKNHKIFLYDYCIFYSGKVLKFKNVDIIINMVNELKKQAKNSLMIISGKDSPHNININYMQEIKSLIKQLKLEKNVIFIEDEIEEKNNGDSFEIVKDFYRLADIVINLSGFENFGLPLIEAGINKTPLIVNDLNVFKEIDNVNIHFVDIDNESPEQIASKIRLIIEDNQQIGFFRKIKKNFNLEKIFVEKIIPLIEK